MNYSNSFAAATRLVEIKRARRSKANTDEPLEASSITMLIGMEIFLRIEASTGASTEDFHIEVPTDAFHIEVLTDAPTEVQ